MCFPCRGHAVTRPLFCSLLRPAWCLHIIYRPKYRQNYHESKVLTGFDFSRSPIILRTVFIPEEGFMTIHQVRRIIRLHEKATRHSNEYKKLLGDLGARAKALRHLEQADRLHFQVRGLIRDCASAKV